MVREQQCFAACPNVGEEVKKLREVIAAAEAEHVRDVKRQLTAEAKVQSAQSDLDSATQELAEDTAESEQSLVRSIEAADALDEYHAIEHRQTDIARGTGPSSKERGHLV